MNRNFLPLLTYLIIVLCLPTGDTSAQIRHAGGRLSEILSVGPEESPERNGLSKRSMFEIGGVALTGVGHFVFSEMDASKFFIPLASLTWGAYVYHRARTDRDFLSDVGFASGGLGPSFRDATFVALGATALMARVAARNQSLTLHRDMILLFLLYPAWGLAQQFLVQGLVSRNLTQAEGWLASPYVVTPISAALFGSVHLPNWKLTAGTFALGLAFTPIFLKHGNLWPLGLYHGWLGALFYFWVLERNPWQETVGKACRKTIDADADIDAQGNLTLRLSVKF